MKNGTQNQGQTQNGNQNYNQNKGGKNKQNNQNQQTKIGKQTLPRCNNCNMKNHATADCRRPPKNQTNTVRNNTTSTFCKYCSLNNHTSKDCKNQQKRDEYNTEEERKAVAANQAYCIMCEKRGHSVSTCNKGTGNTGNTAEDKANDPLTSWCQFCNTKEHISSRCVYEARKAEYYKSDTICSTCGWKGHARVCNNPRPGATCTFCARSGHTAQQCTNEQADCEKIWCKFCNQPNHNTSSCKQKDPQRRFHTMNDTVENTCTKCHYKGHGAQACTNPLPGSRCEQCTHTGHSLSSCPLQESKKRIFDSFRSQVHKELNDRTCANPGYTIKTQTLKVPSNLVTDLSGWVVGANNSYVGGGNLRSTFDRMRERSQRFNYHYYHMPWTLHCLAQGFTLQCGHEGCNYDCRIVDSGLDPIMGDSQLTAYDDRDSEHLVFLETTCSHPDWARHMKWTREYAYDKLITEAARTLVQFSPNGGQELDREFFECAEMTEEMQRLKNIQILKTQRQRESVNKAAPGTIPVVVDEVDAAFDREAGQDTVRRGLDAMDLDGEL